MNDKKSDAAKSHLFQEEVVETLNAEPLQNASRVAAVTLRRSSEINSPGKGKRFPNRKSTFTASDLDAGYLEKKDLPLFIAAEAKATIDTDVGDGTERPIQYSMRRVSDVESKRYLPSGQDPLRFLLENGHHLYGRIDDRSQLVALGVKDRGDQWPVVQFCESLQFLFVDREVISEILTTGESQREAFVKCGLWYVGQEDGSEALARVEFEKCILIRKEMVETSFLSSGRNENGLSPLISLFLFPKGMIKKAYVRREPKAITILDFPVQGTFTRESIWFNESDLKERPIALADLELNREYEHLNKKVSPAIYWIFQVAYNRNSLGSIPGDKESIKKLLMGLPGRLVDDIGEPTKSMQINAHCARFAFTLIVNKEAEDSPEPGEGTSRMKKKSGTKVLAKLEPVRLERFKIGASFISNKLAAAISLASVWASTMVVLDCDFPIGMQDQNVRNVAIDQRATDFCKEIYKYFPHGETEHLFHLITGRELPQSMEKEFQKVKKSRGG